jgi:uncharacterized SAM-binding protein YcdF (DUF218 family)
LTDETKLTMSVLLREGVPESAIVRLPDRVTSTRDEARAVAAYLAGRPARRILVVSSGFHTRRARWIFERELAGLGVEVRTAAAHAPDDPGDDWYRTDEGLILYFIESIKLLAYRILY